MVVTDETQDVTPCQGFGRWTNVETNLFISLVISFRSSIDFVEKKDVILQIHFVEARQTFGIISFRKPDMIRLFFFVGVDPRCRSKHCLFVDRTSPDDEDQRWVAALYADDKCGQIVIDNPC